MGFLDKLGMTIRFLTTVRNNSVCIQNASRCLRERSVAKSKNLLPYSHFPNIFFTV